MILIGFFTLGVVTQRITAVTPKVGLYEVLERKVYLFLFNFYR
jgi:hypothetical protein